MKRAWQVGSLALLALMVVQPAMASLACAPPADSSAACTTCPSSMGQPSDCFQPLIVVVQGLDSCCHLDVPDSTQQVLVDRSAQDRGIGYGVIEQPMPWGALPIRHGLELDRVLPAPLPAASLQSLYCAFLN
jgi:hypothetical protein